MSNKTERDLLIEMGADMKHVREKVDHLTSSDIKQWEKMDILGRKVSVHDVIIKSAMGIVGTVTAGIILYFMTRGH